MIGVHAGVDLDRDPVELAGRAERVQDLVVVRLLVGLEVVSGPAVGGNQYQPHVNLLDSPVTQPGFRHSGDGAPERRQTVRISPDLARS